MDLSKQHFLFIALILRMEYDSLFAPKNWYYWYIIDNLQRERLISNKNIIQTPRE